MATFSPQDQARQLFDFATPVISVTGAGGRRWVRNVARPNDPRRGPWLQGEYEILNPSVWNERRACVYLVAGSDGKLRYVGISKNRLKDRWRTSPALDALTGELLPRKQIFHNACWPQIELELGSRPHSWFEVRVAGAETIVRRAESMKGELAEVIRAHAGDHTRLIDEIESWLCGRQAPDLVPWNSAKTKNASELHFHLAAEWCRPATPPS